MDKLPSQGGAREPEGALELRRAIPLAGGEFLAAALTHPAVTEEHVVLITRNRAAGAALLARIAEDPRWNRAYPVRRGLVGNPHTPRHVAARLAKDLYWRDLAAVADDAALSATLRRTAETCLLDRIPDLTIGEQISLSRICGRALLPKLLDASDPRVASAALSNGRMTEADVVAHIQRAGARASTMECIGSHARWREHYAVRLSLARQAATPLAIALGMLTTLTKADLGALAAIPDLAPLVRRAAERVIAAGSGGRGDPEPGDPRPA
ncbi:MAG: hypothetical protein HY049_04125 [Acidobacteria bacterium]|nr:hypothetical protein [Acidobacteriota bacterium]